MRIEDYKYSIKYSSKKVSGYYYWADLAKSKALLSLDDIRKNVRYQILYRDQPIFTVRSLKTLHITCHHWYGQTPMNRTTFKSKREEVTYIVEEHLKQIHEYTDKTISDNLRKLYEDISNGEI